MSARSRMTMRAEIQRQVAGDQWGSDGVPRFPTVGEVPCSVSSKTKRVLRDDGKTAAVEDLRVNVPLSADVQAGDRIGSITNRLGAVTYAGPLSVEKIVRRNGHGSRGSHLELMLVRHK